MKRKQWIVCSSIFLIVIAVFVTYKVNSKEVVDNMIKITHIQTDKAMYHPGDTVKVTIDIQNISKKNIKNSKLYLQASYLGENIGEPVKCNIETLVPDEKKALQVEWISPNKDFKGYLIEAVIKTKKGSIYAEKTVAIDVSSSWVKFPRYGYLYDFGESVEEEEKIDLMNQYHINAIEYYDWHYLHHQPLADGITKEEPGIWTDWSGRKIYGQTIKDYIKAAKERNMINMAYNMIYAGTDTFFKDAEGNPTEAEKWKIYFAKDNDRGQGAFSFHMGTSPSGNGNLFFVNPLNKEWQNHIFAEENKIFDVFDFDGWHGDTVGDWGNMTTADGKPLGYKADGTPIWKVTDTYTQFLNEAKEKLGDKYLSFNPVGAQGIENANVSATDVLYTEFWPWDKDRNGISYDTYYSLVKEIERSMEESKEQSIDGKGKSLVVKSYINYDKTNGNMNDAGVILCDASVYAAGGSRLEIGNGDHMLHVEYYPNDNILMSDNLKKYMQKMTDFTVAYENLLRDGQYTTDNEVSIEDYKVSKSGESNTIWTYTRADDTHEILHLINLLGTDNKWRDERGKKTSPIMATNLKVKYYTNKKVKNIYLASPDRNYNKCTKLDFITGTDESGTFIEFTVSKLKYWNMIYMSE